MEFWLLPSKSLFFLSVVAVIFIHQILKSLKSRSTKSIPQADGSWPIIGHCKLLAGSKLPHEIFSDLADKHGPAFFIRLGVHRVLVVSGPEVVKELFTTNDIAVSSRPKILATKLMGYDHSMFGFSPYGPYWRELRKITTLHLLSTTRLELLRHVHVSETEISIKELYKIWRLKSQRNGAVLVDMKKFFLDLTLNVVLRVVVGKRYSDGDQEALHCKKMIEDFMNLLGSFVAADYIPWLRWLDIGGYEERMKKTALGIDELLDAWLKEHRRRRKSGEDDGEQDFMDVMLSIIEEEACIHSHDADKIIKSTCMSMISGGSDTTSVTLIWALSLLLNNRNALRKAQKEMDDQVGKKRLVTKADIVNLPYLQAIVKETLRLYPAGFLGGIREFNQDCILRGSTIKKGTRLIINMWKLHRDATVWEDPLEFMPERFFSANHKDVDLKGQHYELIPFGAGRRICPGVGFSLQILHFVLANLIQSFDFSTPNNTHVDMTASPGMSNIKLTPLDVLISPRLNPTLYN